MSRTSIKRALIASSFALALTAAFSAGAQPVAQSTTSALPDANLYTSYYFGSGYQNVTWIVCGSTAATEGCYGSGTLGPFGKAGALLQSDPVEYEGAVIRYIYVVDTAAGTGKSVKLDVYKKSDVTTNTGNTTTVTLVKAVPLPQLVGGAGATAYLAANSGYLFVGTNLSTDAIKLEKTNLTNTFAYGGFSPALNLAGISADSSGNVTMTYGSAAAGGFTGNIQIGADGSLLGDGGGAWVSLNPAIGLITDALPTSDTFPVNKMHVRLKKNVVTQGAAGQ